MITPPASPPMAVIAEDEDLGRLLLGESASTAGLNPRLFDNGLDALQAALSLDVAIVLLDVDMPGMDGYAVCRAIRATPRLATVPVVMVTGHDDTRAIDMAFDAGATDYVSKPVNWALLPHRLAYILRNAATVRALADREAKVRTLVEAIPDTMWVVSPDGEPRWSPSDPAPSPQWGAEAITMIRLTAQDGVPRRLEYRDDSTQSAHRSEELCFSVCESGDVLVVRRDTSERTTAAEHIERLAYLDSLTGLPNRQRFTETAQRLIADARDSRQAVACVYLDLISFKRVNDTFGHSVGDLLLQNVAARLRSALQPFEAGGCHISLYRLGGDEFVILVRDDGAKELGLRIAAACCDALSEPLMCRQLELFAGPSIGVAVCPEDGEDLETLLKHADTAMYYSKARGVPAVSAYSPAMSARLRDRLALESRLRRAIRDNLVSLKYQPKYRLKDNAIVGVEALIRWCDEELGEISPSQFIPVAEETGLIVELGAWAIRTACAQARLWLDRGIHLPVAVNVSGKEFLFGDPVRVLETEMTRHQLPPSMIEIEITESVFVSDSNGGLSSIGRIRRLGCRLALDDFGTGYSSLAYLTRFPPDRIKIDRSFVQKLDRSPTDAAIVNAILSLARALNLVVTAEGVEHSHQLAWLRDKGCHEAQGFLLSKPMRATEVERLIEGMLQDTRERAAQAGEPS